MRHSSPRWPRLALPLGVGGRITTVHARTLDSNGRHLPSSPSRSIRPGIWRWATPRAPRQLPSLTPPDREIQTPEANSRVDKTWGQGHVPTVKTGGGAAHLYRRCPPDKLPSEQSIVLRQSPEVRELGEVVRRGRAPGHGVEVRQRLEDREGSFPRRLVWRAVAPLPAPRIGINKHLEALQHPVVCQCVRGLFQIDRQLVRLDAAEDGCAQVRDANVAAPNAIRIEVLIPVPGFQEKGAFALASLALPRRNQAHQLIPQDQQAGGVFAQQLAQPLHP